MGKSKTVLSNKINRSIRIFFEKKVYSTTEGYNAPTDTVFYQYGKWPITTKTCGGSSWSPLQIKVEKG